MAHYQHDPHTRFLAGWLLANVLGWTIGLFLGGGVLRLVGSIAGVLLGGAVAGGCVGIAQMLILRSGWRWGLISALGGGLAALPAYIAGVTLIAGPMLGYFSVGAVYGLIFGLTQWLGQQAGSRSWVAINTVAGGLCGWLTLGFNPWGLPLICSPGPVIFGLLTGLLLLHGAGLKSDRLNPE